MLTLGTFMMPMYMLLKVFIITFAVSSAYELLALNTRFNIFGARYHYNLKQPAFKYNLLGLPIIMPFLWAIHRILIPTFLGFIWFDLVVDPLARHANWWKFNKGGIWFGVPLTNYIGWAIVWLTVEGVLWLLR